MKLKNKILIIGGLMLCMLANPIKANAALQANGNSPTTAKIANWLVNIRQMEATGGTLGLDDTIDGTTLLSSNSNNLDIHMEKNTEYGAMAILSASAYGNPNVIGDGETTTGNESGVVININKEWVSAGDVTENKIFQSINAKYFNSYVYKYAAKAGDAINETNDWHNSGAETWFNSSYMYYSGLLRSYSGSIFSYYGDGAYGKDAKSDLQPWYSRAVVVVGQGF